MPVFLASAGVLLQSQIRYAILFPMLGDGVQPGVLGIKYYLGEAVSVPKKYEFDSTEIPDPVHPAVQCNFFARVGFSQFATGVGSILQEQHLP